MPGGYFGKRKHLIYYQYISMIMHGLAQDARSLLDVGSSNAPYLEEFTWIPTRHALDVRSPYSSPNVTGIKANFFEFEPERKYDFCTCFQVLEHIEDARAFARRLTMMSDRILVSVPYNWPAKSNVHHVHDPVDQKKLASWFGRDPDYSVVVTEPLMVSKKSRRLIAYFHNAGAMPPVIEYRQTMAATFNKRPAGNALAKGA